MLGSQQGGRQPARNGILCAEQPAVGGQPDDQGHHRLGHGPEIERGIGRGAIEVGFPHQASVSHDDQGANILDVRGAREHGTQRTLIEPLLGGARCDPRRRKIDRLRSARAGGIVTRPASRVTRHASRTGSIANPTHGFFGSVRAGFRSKKSNGRSSNEFQATGMTGQSSARAT
jgi:hypothetical protein